ncbi:hypothetical protein [Agrobacterium sp. CG674]
MTDQSPVAAQAQRFNMLSVQIRLPSRTVAANNLLMNTQSKNIAIWWWGSFTRP